ncbi:hypothetical protein AQJ91_23455 [Streptomyces dysideae]|uniref:Uncharacterized protein n=1 Tax=Streptomyces dysideae TaxID=909626 RepID=A0A101UXQ6_9ACTN|nr:hypothetical protein AQJ91_23455 [Streptomyces dysideae]
MPKQPTKPRYVYWTATEQVAHMTTFGPQLPYQRRDLTICRQPAHQGERRIGIERAGQVQPSKQQSVT